MRWRSMGELSRLLGYSADWVRDHLRRFALESAAGGEGNSGCPLVAAEDHRRVKTQINQIVRKFAPAKPDEEYVLEYETEGHTPEVAKPQDSA